MIVYQSTKQGFCTDIKQNRIADRINDAYYEHLGRHTSQSEYNSWKNSMMYMNVVINDTRIPDNAGISIEYQIPLTSNRIDFLISGYDQQNKEQVVIVELKQWSKAKLTDKDALVSTRFAQGEREVAHPSYQALSYANLLRSFNVTIQEKDINLSPCAYLHNYHDDGVITNKFYQEYIRQAPAFLASDAEKLQEFITRRIKKGDDREIIFEIENGKLKPSKYLADSVYSMLQGNNEFTLIDNQKVAYETVLSACRKAKAGSKNVIIVEGGPGTGKSVVAVNLLANLIHEEKLAMYVSKNAEPRNVYSTLLAKNSVKKKLIQSLFSGSGSFTDVKDKKDAFHALIVDEAHRLNLKSGLYGNQGENQVAELINAAKVTVFFVDDNQQIHVNDIGRKKYIEEVALSMGAKVQHLELDSQFRCNGADGYLAWLDNTMEIKDTANILLSPSTYDFRIFDDPNDMDKAIRERNEVNNRSRIVAGYCWPWDSKKDASKMDVVINEYNYARQWNFTNKNESWILQPESISEVGCIHTCQGLELDYVGVIVGQDMRYEDGCVVTDITQRHKSDRSIFGLKKRLKGKDYEKEMALEQADLIIKNTYRTLMTRGMKGCYVYFEDKALAAHFRSLLVKNYAEALEEVDATIAAEEEQSALLPKEDSAIRIEPTVNDNVRYVDFLPFYSVHAACGYFGDGEHVDVEGWVDITQLGRKVNRWMFAVRACGHSMEPNIQDGDICVFTAQGGGSREGKTVLVEHTNKFDPEYSGRYSIKRYHSEKVAQENGGWGHSLIKLMPTNDEYSPIVIDEASAEEGDFRVIGEFVGVVK